MEEQFKTTDEYLDYLNFMNNFNEMLMESSENNA